MNLRANRPNLERFPSRMIRNGVRLDASAMHSAQEPTCPKNSIECSCERTVASQLPAFRTQVASRKDGSVELRSACAQVTRASCLAPN
jgi:hypothetical protein